MDDAKADTGGHAFDYSALFESRKADSKMMEDLIGNDASLRAEAKLLRASETALKKKLAQTAESLEMLQAAAEGEGGAGGMASIFEGKIRELNETVESLREKYSASAAEGRENEAKAIREIIRAGELETKLNDRCVLLFALNCFALN